MGHTALGHCCLGLIHWHCTAVVVVVVVMVVVVVVVVEEVGIGRGHSNTTWQVRCPFTERHNFWAGPTGCVRWAGGRAFRGGRRLGQRQGGQRRRGMSIQYMGNGGRWPKNKRGKKKKVKGEGKRGRRIHF